MKDKAPQLQAALSRLEESAKRIVETRGYTRDVAKLKLLAELIREQIQGENTHSTARQAR